MHMQSLQIRNILWKQENYWMWHWKKLDTIQIIIRYFLHMKEL